jgi:hypothetical protein
LGELNDDPAEPARVFEKGTDFWSEVPAALLADDKIEQALPFTFPLSPPVIGPEIRIEDVDVENIFNNDHTR